MFRCRVDGALDYHQLPVGNLFIADKRLAMLVAK